MRAFNPESAPHPLSRSTSRSGARPRPFGRSSVPLTVFPSTSLKRTISPRAPGAAISIGGMSANRIATRMSELRVGGEGDPDREGRQRFVPSRLPLASATA